MPRLWMVRHGEASAGFGDHRDPGLSPRGGQQAANAAALLSALLGETCGTDPDRLPEVRTSPLRRCMETAAPIAEHLMEHRVVDPMMAEIPSPTEDLAERSAWLGDVLASRWPERPARERRWRSDLLSHVRELARDAVVVTHFVPINVVVGEARGRDEVVVARCANCSITIVDVDPATGAIAVVAGGAEGDSEVL